MKTLACSLTAVISLALASAALGASAQQRVSGTVISSDIQGFVIETATKEHVAFHMEAGKPKVGEKVTVHYYITGRGNVYAKKIDKGWARPPIKAPNQRDSARELFVLVRPNVFGPAVHRLCR